MIHLPSSIWNCGLVLLFCIAARAEQPKGLIAEWKFDAGKGETAQDSSGGGRDARLHGASWVRQGKGFAVMLDGIDDYLDFDNTKPFPITGPVTFELWFKPMRKAHGMASIIGESISSYTLTYYNTELCQLYIGDGGNSVRGSVMLNEWNHVVSSYDGSRLKMWINGRLTGDNESRISTYKTSGTMEIGTKGQPALPRFKGMIDEMRVYDRGLTAEEVAAHFSAEAADHDIDLSRFSRVKVTPYYYFEQGEIYVEADFDGLQPLKGKGRLEVTLAKKESPLVVIQSVVVEDVPARFGVTEVKLPCSNLPRGNYTIRAVLSDEHGKYPTEEFEFAYPPSPKLLPSPNEKVVGEIPANPPATPFRFAMGEKGGFKLTVKNKVYPFETRISWPNGEFNRLASDNAGARGEPAWAVQARRIGDGKFRVTAGGAHYKLQRQIEVFADHVQIKDEYTNTTAQDLGLLIYNETPLAPGQVTGAWLSGYERMGRQVELSYPDYGPSGFFTDANTGMGIIPIDDVFVLQGVPYIDWQAAAGVCTEKFALAPGASYTLEWAIYPTASRDYYDFINTFRKVENRIATVSEAPAFITTTPHAPWRREVASKDYLDKRQLKLGLMHSISETADDDKLHVEGIELFRDFPKELELIRQQVAKTRELDPSVKMLQHIAHSLYCTNNPDQFSDSKVIGPDGKQATWGDGEAFGPDHQANGWRWWVFYPTPGNSFHNAMLKSVDMMMDQTGLGGGFMDGFFAGYGGMWTYDRWDNHSALIDPATKVITRKLGSVMLLSQPSMIAYARKIRDKGGAVVAMHSVFTRSIANEKYIGFANESASGPELHLAPNVMALGNHVGFRSEKGIYLDILSKLEWGELYIHYVDGRPLTHRSLASYQYPITFEEIRPGMVRGKERIVTMNSGVYGWPGSRDLHLIHPFDPRGAPVPNAYLTTVDAKGVRSELKFNKDESAVIEPIPVELGAKGAMNVQVTEFGPAGFRAVLNGKGDATLTLRLNDVFPLKGEAYQASVNEKPVRIEPTSNGLSVQLKLDGITAVVIRPAKAGG